MRNLGGGRCLALINTLLDKRMDLHLERLQNPSPGGVKLRRIGWPANDWRRWRRAGREPKLARTRQLALIVRRQAEVMALSDVFLTLTVVFLGCVGWPQ